MQWWQYVIVSIIPVVIYIVRSRAAKRDKFLNAMCDILVELDSNVGLAKQPFRGSLVPFESKMWDSHKGETLSLSKDIQDALHEAYICVSEANAIVQSNLQLPYGRGYYNEDYKKKCSEIAEKAEKASELLRNWLRQKGVKELPNA